MTDDSSARFRARREPEGHEPSPKIDPTAQIVGDLQQLVLDAAEIVALGREHFLGNSGAMARHAADGILINVQELCDRLPEDFRSAHTEIPWAAVRGIRNRLGHNYRATDHKLVWNTISRDLKTLIEAIAEGAAG